MFLTCYFDLGLETTFNQCLKGSFACKQLVKPFFSLPLNFTHWMFIVTPEKIKLVNRLMQVTIFLFNFLSQFVHFLYLCGFFSLDSLRNPMIM